ncbi:MAG: hypothetical protein ACKO81_12250 [Planctomycetota bacterium]
MARLPRIALCLCLPLVCLGGCKPFQQGTLSRMQTPLPAAEELTRRKSAPGAVETADASQVKLFDSPANAAFRSKPSTSSASSSDAHATDATGYRESCGVNHGSSGTPDQFRFTQPLPQFQPVASPNAPSSRKLSSVQNSASEQTFSSAIRVIPLKPDEAINPQASFVQKSSKPAPPPQPDDSPTETSSGGETNPKASSVAFNQPLTPATQTSLLAPSSQPAEKTDLRSGAAKPKSLTIAQATPSLIATTRDEANSARAVTVAPGSAPLESKANSEPASAVTGTTELSETLNNLKNVIANSESLDPAAEFTAELTALELLIERVNVLAASESEPTEAQSLCEHQLQALVATLRPESLDISRPEGRQIATRTLEHLREAISQLEKLVSLKITHGTLCTEVRGFGQYKPFSSMEFRVGQPVLLYCEIENFCSVEEQAQSDVSDYRTRLKSSLVICREDGTVAQQAEFPVVEDIARNRRRDFYLYVPFTVGELSPGKYRAHLMVDDLQGRKQAVLDPPVEFTVR